ncbi:MAG: DegT/DnrJ/EryC1/StrS aminotransferase family protein [Candidatus Bathyarchaeota archaeon]|nr:DegT/DnrJ/EryC1/StrS aminotransferase family protein [Candidatus Bathyarchaeota archaeon]MDH5746565.1 DegT/DnrJ/EryC1/StrS aminotransferase family protein [Candidatus Bathyarchaeota archaeon]
MIPINAPRLGEEEIKAVVKVMKSGFLTHGLGAGPVVTKFEKAFAKFVGAKHAIAVNTGTSALHLAIAGAGIKQGDEVILPSFTFVSTAEVIAIAGAKPVFVDIDPETHNISPKKVEKALTKKTKAVMPVDLYGLPADMQPIKDIADKHGLTIIEDSAQAHGASYKGKPVGTFADAACWSFYASKNMTTGEGGMITTNNGELAEKMRFMRSHGEKEKYKSLMLGHNYRMPEIQAAIGCVQLKKLPKFLAKRRENVKRLTAELGKAKNLQLPKEPKGCKHSWYLYTIRLKGPKGNKRDKIVEALRQKGIGAEVYYTTPIHLMPYYRKFGRYRLPETEKAAKHVLSLPVHPGVNTKQTGFISESVLHLVG